MLWNYGSDYFSLRLIWSSSWSLTVWKAQCRSWFPAFFHLFWLIYLLIQTIILSAINDEGFLKKWIHHWSMNASILFNKISHFIKLLHHRILQGASWTSFHGSVHVNYSSRIFITKQWKWSTRCINIMNSA